MSNATSFTINGIERKVRVVRSEGQLSVEVQYDINDLLFWLPINTVDDVATCDDDFLLAAIAEADAVIDAAFQLSDKETDDA
jgi:hypothetical protein